MSISPNKSESHRVHVTVGSDRLSYEGPTTTKFASLITTKVLLKIVVSIILSRYMCADIHNFYYKKPMDNFEYMKLLLSIYPQKTVQQYNLECLVAADG